MLKRLFARTRRSPSQAELDARAVDALRQSGVRVGENCRIYTSFFGTEPWLVVVGNNVGISGGVKFLTHDGAAFRIRDRKPRAQKLGTILVGDDVFIGENALLLAGTVIGKGCIIGPGAVVRGTIPENSLVFGNPAEVVGRASLYLERMLHDVNTLDTYGLDQPQRRQIMMRHFFPEEPA